MSLNEKRLLVLLSPIVRTTKVKEGESAFLSADSMQESVVLVIAEHTMAYQKPVKNLYADILAMYLRMVKKTVANWILRSTYDEGGVDVFFTNEVLTMLQVFDKLNPYTKYKKEIILKLKGDYSFEIYHIAKQSEGLGKTDVPLNDLKKNLDVPDSYHDLSNFKKRVLEPACDEISQNTDITLSYETVKRGRSVVAIRFIIKNKTDNKSKVNRAKGDLKDPNTPDLFTKLTPLEVNLYAKKLANDPEFGSKHIEPGESFRKQKKD